jgi:hypothetical protein
MRRHIKKSCRRFFKLIFAHRGVKTSVTRVPPAMVFFCVTIGRDLVLKPDVRKIDSFMSELPKLFENLEIFGSANLIFCYA